VGPFKILERKGPVAYHLALPSSLDHMHDVFHVSVLHHYISDPSHVIDLSHLQMSDEGALMTETNPHFGPTHSTTSTSFGRPSKGPMG
jgi:hypothetical protein